MHEVTGQCVGYTLLVHGGAGPQDPDADRLEEATLELQRIANAGMEALKKGEDPLEVIVTCLQDMEDCERFNAGRGSALQSDGQARLTAAIMESQRETLSGVICASYVAHPSLMARHLQNSSSKVLTSPGTELLARELGLPAADNLSISRVQKWAGKIEKGHTFCDTVGCIVRTPDGRLLGGTSTGGRGMEYPGRVSDSATVAGTYITKNLAAVATGIGEEIVDDALCARLETRVRDGMGVGLASAKCLAEATVKKRSYGWIAVDPAGNWAVTTTTPSMSFVVVGEEEGVCASALGD